MNRKSPRKSSSKTPAAPVEAGEQSPPHPPPWLLPVVTFCSGASIMIVELSGNRLIAPVFGNTIYTWTSLIGIVLMAMSLGGYLGGVLADRRGKAGDVALLLIGAGLFSILIPFIARLTEGWVDATHLIVGPLVMCSLLFLVPGVLLGAVSPYAVKLLSVWRPDHAVGKSAGLVSMAGALGSFAGTFATGFWLLSAFDLRLILGATGALLVLLGVAVAAVEKLRVKQAVAAGVATLLALTITSNTPVTAEEDMLFAKNTYYHLVRVAEDPGPPGGGPVRYLMLDSTTEGAVDLADGSLPLAYQNAWRLAAANPEFSPKRALFIGAGAFGMPMAASAHWPEARVEVVEIDPEVIEVGRRFFGLDNHPGVEPHAGDGRRFVRLQPEGAYDLIFGDAYNGVSYVPPHLVTAEFFRLVASRLAPDGLYMMNLISPVRDPEGSLAAGVLAGLAEAFPHLALLRVATPDLRERQNLILLASKQPLTPFLEPGSPDPFTARFLSGRLPQATLEELLVGTRPYTDMHNPIDRVIARQLLRDGKPAKVVF